MLDAYAETLILLPICYIGIVTSIEDARFGKIYHRHVLLGLGVGFGWLALFSAYRWLLHDDPGFLTHTVPLVLAATAIAFAISGAMWWFNVWSAADAKLFTVFALLLPLSVYHGGNRYFSSLVLMVNSYAIAFVVISADFLVRLLRILRERWEKSRRASAEERRESRRQTKEYLKENAPVWLKTFLGFLLLLMAIRILRNIARGELEHVIHVDETMLFLLLFLAFKPLHLLFQIRAVAVAVVVGLCGFLTILFYQDPTGGRLVEMVHMGLWSLGLMCFRQIYSFWAKLIEIRRIPLADLREHMIVAHGVKLELLAKEIFTAEEMKLLGVEGLSAEHAQRIRELYEDEEKSGTIAVEKTIPFAPFLFAGLLATFIKGGVLIRLG